MLSTPVIVSLLFAFTGTTLLVFGFKVSRMPFMLTGLALMACAFSMGNLIALVFMSTLLGILPWVISKP